jgi:hypothetical protein
MKENIILSFVVSIILFFFFFVSMNIHNNTVEKGIILEKYIEYKSEEESTFIFGIGEYIMFTTYDIPKDTIYYFKIKGFDRKNELKVVNLKVTKTNYNLFNIGQEFESKFNNYKK